MDEIIIKAFKIALKKHKYQIRKIKKNPFIIHPINVGNILIGENADENLIAAGFLHDIIEDTNYTLQDLEKDFNEDIKELVSYASEDMNKSWEKRKEEMILKCKTCSKRELLLEFADKLSNLESIFFEVNEFGIDILKKFNNCSKEIKDYYLQMLNIFKSRLENLNNLQKYEFYLNNLF